MIQSQVWQQEVETGPSLDSFCKHLCFFVGPEKPLVNNLEKEEDVEHGGLSPEHRECNGSRSSKNCKHKEKRERMEKERERDEQLKTHEEIQQEEIQPVHNGKLGCVIYKFEYFSWIEDSKRHLNLNPKEFI